MTIDIKMVYFVLVSLFIMGMLGVITIKKLLSIRSRICSGFNVY